MKDFLKFTFRGALGATIMPALLLPYYFIDSNNTGLVWYFLNVGISLTIHGATIGAIVWVCALYLQRLRAILRITIGVAVNSALFGVLWATAGHPWFPEPLFMDSSLPTSHFLVLLAAFFALMGGCAGWVCPPNSIYRDQLQPLTWEQVRQYAVAQAEQDFWTAMLEAETGREGKDST
jgi:hypothetical protein